MCLIREAGGGFANALLCINHTRDPAGAGNGQIKRWCSTTVAGDPATELLRWQHCRNARLQALAAEMPMSCPAGGYISKSSKHPCMENENYLL
eukprot:1158185-Pelagomonas_calceolata.AAC.7